MDLFKKSLWTSSEVIPSPLLTRHGSEQKPLSASSLTIGSEDTSHFYTADGLGLKSCHGSIIKLFQSLGKNIKIALSPLLIKCESKIVANLDLLNGTLRNEQELQYATGDPILELICDVGGFKVCVQGFSVGPGIVLAFPSMLLFVFHTGQARGVGSAEPF